MEEKHSAMGLFHATGKTAGALTLGEQKYKLSPAGGSITQGLPVFAAHTKQSKPFEMHPK